MKFTQREILLENIIEEEEKRTKIEESGKREKEPNILGISKAVDEYYFLMKMELYCTYLYFDGIVNSQSIGYKEQDFKLLEPILEELRLSPPENPLTKIYYELAMLLKDYSETPSMSENSGLKVIEQNIASEFNNMTTNELLGVFTGLLNFCARKMNLGYKAYAIKYFKYASEVVNLNERDKKPMPAALFQNMVKIMLREGLEMLSKTEMKNGISPKAMDKIQTPQEWCRKFIHRYHKRIPESKGRNAHFDYCNMLVLFSEKRFEEAYKAISQKISLYKGILFSLEFRILYLQIIYELYNKNNDFISKQNIEIEDLTEAFRRKFEYDTKKKKVKLGYHAQYFNDFLSIIQKMFPLLIRRKAGIKSDTKKVSDLISGKHYYYIDWVKEKLKELA